MASNVIVGMRFGGDEAAPSFQRPVPTIISSTVSAGGTLSGVMMHHPDPDLCLTPDKTIIEESPDKGNDSGSGHTPKQVRFNVPSVSESSSSGGASMTEISIVDIAADDDLTLGTLDDTLALTDTSQLDVTVIDDDKENSPAVTTEPQFLIDSDLDITIDDQQQSKPVENGVVSRKQQRPLKPIANTATTSLKSSDDFCHREKGKYRASRKTTTNEDVLHRDKPSLYPVDENILKKPEFQTTLKVTREIQQLKTQDLDVRKRVEEKMKKLSIKTEIEEKGAMKVNKPESFTCLNSLELPAEELIRRKERDKTKQSEAAAKLISAKTKDQKSKEPDLMEFFDCDLQSETASFVLEGLPSFEPPLQTAPPNSSFKLYKHSRCWDRLI
ncbi:uncharacterized protein LOC141907992 [Tubulanus polymorphus]|uniref:uncharacterized protein LOC141907992 n=1 Tax=Tubulanus polymorphus TaxID=672921 RepID=UPI003DA3F0DD